MTDDERAQEYVFLGSHDEIEWVELWRGIVPAEGIMIDGASAYHHQKLAPAENWRGSEETAARVAEMIAEVRERMAAKGIIGGLRRPTEKIAVRKKLRASLKDR